MVEDKEVADVDAFLAELAAESGGEEALDAPTARAAECFVSDALRAPRTTLPGDRIPVAAAAALIASGLERLAERLAAPLLAQAELRARGDLTGAEVLWHRAVEEVGGAVLREVLTEGRRLLVAGQA